MPSTMPLRVGDDLLASARLAAEVSGRSTAQQIGYWAKLGRELERSHHVSVRDVAEVLAGQRAYDDLDPRSQAVVRAAWAQRTDARRAALDLAEEFRAEGRSWVERGPDGRTVRRHAQQGPETAADGESGGTAARKRSPKRSSTRR